MNEVYVKNFVGVETLATRQKEIILRNGNEIIFDYFGNNLWTIITSTCIVFVDEDTKFKEKDLQIGCMFENSLIVQIKESVYIEKNESIKVVINQ